MKLTREERCENKEVDCRAKIITERVSEQNVGYGCLLQDCEAFILSVCVYAGVEGYQVTSGQRSGVDFE